MKRLIFAAAVLVTTTVTLAGPLKPKLLPASTTWFVHMDAEAVKSSIFGMCLLARMEEAGANEFDEMQSKLGIDLEEDVYSLTVFGLGTRPAKGINVIIGDKRLEVAAIANPDESVAALAVVNSDAARSLIEHLSEVKQAYRQISLGDYKVHAMIEPAGEGDEDGEGETKLLVYIKSSDDPSRKTLVVSDKKQLLLTAIKALEGDAPNLSSNEGSSLSTIARTGSLFVLSASDIHQLTGGNGGSKILKGSKAFSFEISEANGIVHLSASMTTESAELAKYITDAVQGIIAIAQLSMNKEDKDIATILTLAKSIEFNSDDNKINVNFEHSAKELCILMGSHLGKRSYDEDENTD